MHVVSLEHVVEPCHRRIPTGSQQRRSLGNEIAVKDERSVIGKSLEALLKQLPGSEVRRQGSGVVV